MFSFKKSKKYSGEHAQARREKVKYFKPQLLSRWPLLLPGDFGSSQTNTVLNGVISFSDERQQVNKAHVKSSDGKSSETALLRKNHVFSLILSLHLIVSAKILCTVGINNCKANTPCNLTLQLCFLHESQNTVERKGNTATPIWSGWFLFHRCSYHTTGSPQTAEMLPQCSSNYKESQPSDAFGPRHARELNTWLEAFYFKVCISRGHVKIREDLSHRHKNANTCMFFGLDCI